MLRGILISAVLAFSGIALLQGCAATIIGGAATGGAVAHDRRTTGTVIDDQGIEFKAMQMMNDHPELNDHSSISVTSYNYTLLLTGDAENADIPKRYARLVSEIQKVQRVVNEVAIGPNATLSEQSHDAYVTTKAILALFDLDVPGFDPTRVKVLTQKGTLFLMGLVTREEGKVVTDQVRNVDGVLRVVKVFEYIER